MFSRFFIKRPIFATVLAILMVIAGAICVFTPPIAQYPDITPPTVSVSATYPGANARTVAQAVGVPIEAQVNGVENMLYMSSTSSDGSYSLTITFENGTDVDQAAIDVQNRLSEVTSTLPEAVTEQGVSVRNSEGDMVSFSAFATVTEVMGESNVNRYNMYTTASLTATPAKEVSSSEGIKAMEEIVTSTLGQNYSYAWTGMAYEENESGTTVTVVFIFAIIMTLLVLAAQYESWTDPIAVVLAMPIAVLGTLLGTMLMSEDINIYTQIGLILVLGMSAKNAILIVEYAMDFRKAGVPIVKAAHDAGVIRFRPIMMTALAFIFGVMPMLFSTGAGANSRIDLGTAVVFGMVVNALIGTTCVPAFWVVMQRLQERFRGKRDTDADSNGVQSAQSAIDNTV